MGLNIKNPRVHELAREAARRTGRSQTSAIELALERLLTTLDAEEGQGPQALLTFMQDRLAAGPPLNVDDLYDEQGLPR